MTFFARLQFVDGKFVKVSMGSRIADLLARTADKKTPDATLSQFSVKQLLELNTCKLDKCDKAELDKHATICNKFVQAREDVRCVRG